MTLTLGSALASFEVGASGFTAFGPRVYLRQNGQPVTEVDTFTTSVTGAFTLEIHNGGLEDDEYHLVSSSVIFLNGAQILSPNELNQNISYLEKSVTLQAVNEISVEVRGKPGGTLIIYIVGDDNIPPAISINVAPPANASGWHASNPTVSFTCSDIGSAVASCTSPFTVSTEGAGQVVTGTVTDLAGNTATVSETINLDKNLPVLSISSPASGITVADPVINIVGQVTDSISAVQLTANGVVVMPGSGGSFSHPVTLTEGANTISVVATDVAGNAYSTSLSVLLISNQAPVASGQLATLDEDSNASIVLTATDIDSDPLNYQVVSQPTNGSLSGVSPNLVYQPAANFSGSDNFSFKANDGQSDSNTAMVSIQVMPVNDAPVINSTPVLVGRVDQPYSYQIMATDVELDALTYAVATGPAAMTVSANGLVSWTPTQAEVGINSITLSVSDSNGDSTTQSYNLEIEAAPNTPPTITSTPTTMATIDQAYSYTVTTADVDGDALTFSGVALPNGMSVDSASGEITWTPGQAEIGAHLVSVQVDDGNGGTADQEFTLVVSGTDAANAAHMGTEFWIPRYSNPKNIQLVISSEINTSGIVEILGSEGQGQTPFNTQAGQSTLIDVPVPIFVGTGPEYSASSGLRGWAVNVKSDDPISVRVIYFRRAASDALLALPVRSFGTEYVTSNLGGSPLGHYPRAVFIADQDNTQVTITAAKELVIGGVTVLPGEQHTISLNRGEDFHLKPLPFSHDFSGTIINSDKPIGVYSGHDCGFVPEGVSFCNMLVEQLPSTSLWKNEYLTAPLRSRYGESIRVYTATDNTTVNVNGVLQGIINRSQYLTFQLDVASVISADNPIQVIQHSNSLGWDQTARQADPFWNLKTEALNQAAFWATDQIIEIDPAPAANYAFVLMPLANIGDLVVDGVPVSDSAFGANINWISDGRPSPGGYSGVQIALNPGVHRFNASVPFGLFKNTEGLYQYADPSMTVVSATDNYQSAYTFQTPGNGFFARHFINITVPTTSINNVLLDGQSVDPAHFFPLGSSDHSYARLGVNVGGHTISGSEPFGLLVYGFDDADAYSLRVPISR